MNRRTVDALVLLVSLAGCGPDGGPRPADGSGDDLPAATQDSSPGPAARYRGYDAINDLLEDRVVAAPADFELSAYFGPPLVPPTITGTVATEGDVTAILAYVGARERRRALGSLLGTWGGSGPTNTFRNGLPNGLSLLLWENALRGLAADLTHLALGSGDATLGVSGLALRPEAQAALEGLAAWPDPRARSTEALEALWNVVLRADAPEVERAAWVEYCLGPDYASAPASDVLPDILAAMLLDPYLLLTR